MGVVLNAPISGLNLVAVARAVDIPVIVTVTKRETDITARIKASASILNVAGGSRTPEIVQYIRETASNVPIIATGGSTNETIRATITAGANAVTYTPPSAKVMFSEMIVSASDKM